MHSKDLVPNDDVFLSSYTLLVGSRAVDSPTNGYFVPFNSGGLPQPWKTLPFPSELNGPLDGKRRGMQEPMVLIVMGFETHCATHRAV